MNRDQWQTLLGGYATRTLSPEDEQALIAAALEDQELFDALAREQPLRDLLSDPASRARLIQVLEPRTPWWQKFWGPAGLAATAAVAAAAVAVVFLVNYKPAQKPVTIAQVKVTEPAKPSPVPVPGGAGGSPAPRKPRPASRGRLPETPVLDAPPPAPPQPIQAVGGIVGGVPGGIAPSAPPPPPPPPPQMAPMADSARTMYAQSENKTAEVRAESPAVGLRRETMSAVAPRAAKAKKAAASLPPAIRYVVTMQTTEDEFNEVPAGTVFESNARVRLRFEPDGAGYLYVLQREASGGWQLLTSNFVPRLAVTYVPATGTLAYASPGPKTLFVVFSRQPQPALARLDQDELERRFGAQPAPAEPDVQQVVITLNYR